ncbi:MAG: hypothetical protein GX556_03035 [Fibrobacter sp.]|nr:hypothetical protein [Fibrobacter sp.]
MNKSIQTSPKFTLLCAVIITFTCLTCSRPGKENTVKQNETRGKCGQTLDAWEWRDPLPWGNSPCDIAYGNGQFVVAADGGVIFTSSDGIDWKRKNLCTLYNFHSIVYEAGQFVAVGDSGTIFTSRDALSWYSRNSGTRKCLNAVSFGNNRFVAAGEDGTICVSQDAVSWKLNQQSAGDDFRDLTFGSGTFAAISYPGSIFTSIDGIDWVRIEHDSTDNSHPRYLYYIFYAQNTFMASGNVFLTSTDGKKWRKQEELAKYNLIFCIPAGDRCLAFGTIEKNYKKTVIAVSLKDQDGITWTPVDLKGDTLRFMSKCAYGAGIFAGLGGANCIYTSQDGSTWTRRIQEKSSFGYKLPRSVAYGNGRFIVVCTRGGVYTSPDGVVWTTGNSRVKEDFVVVAFKGDRFAAMSEDGSLMTSIDGVTWNSLDRFEPGHFLPVIFAAEKYIAVGDFGTVLTSPDAISWTIAKVPTKQRLISAAYGAGQFVAVGENGTIISSSDGATWETRSSGTTEDIYSIAYGAGRFIAVGFYGLILTSPDGITWTQEISGTQNFFHSITWGDNQFLAVGTHGILASRTASDSVVASPADTIFCLWPSADYTSYDVRSVYPRSEAWSMEAMVPVNLQTFSFPDLPVNGKSIDDFIPQGWDILDSVSGDLNKDNSADIAMVIQYRDSVHIDESFSQPRVLVILFKGNNDNQYHLAEQSNTFILMDDEPNREDPFSGIGISKGVLNLNFHLFYTMGSWFMTGSSYKFRYQGNEFVLIGADMNIYARNTSDFEDFSYNFLTKKRRFIKGSFSEESEVKNDTVWSTIKIDKLETMKTFSQPYSWKVDQENYL